MLFYALKHRTNPWFVNFDALDFQYRRKPSWTTYLEHATLAQDKEFFDDRLNQEDEEGHYLIEDEMRGNTEIVMVSMHEIDPNNPTSEDVLEMLEQ
jgi:hypothetical protein